MRSNINATESRILLNLHLEVRKSRSELPDKLRPKSLFQNHSSILCITTMCVVQSIYCATKISRLSIRDTDPQGKLYGSPHLRVCVAAFCPY